MIFCKRHIIAAGFILMLPLLGWSEAPVVDDSDNFAIIDEQQANDSPVVDSKYDESQNENAQTYRAKNNNYSVDNSQGDDGPPLAKDDQASASDNAIADNAKLIDKIQSLQQEVQELRGQLEVQAHDLKLLQQQQIAFYKDLDARLGNTAAKSAQTPAPTDISLGSRISVPQVNALTAEPKITKPAPITAPAIAVSRVNPADEQIGYMAAYELVKNKRYDDALKAMSVFVQKYPNGGYTANAQYWLGELYLVKKDYSKAIEHFDLVLQQFPSSSKSAACLLKSGYAYAAKGDKQEAKKRLQQVIKNYPDTPTAQLANSKLQAINAI